MKNFPKHDLARLVIDIAPLRETQFTGIPNVVKEVALRALRVPAADLAIDFAVGDRHVDRDIVAATVALASGKPLNDALRSGVGVRDLSARDTERAAGLNLHIKSPQRRFPLEAVFFHDLSFLSLPRVHQEETVRAHLDGFAEQMASTDLFFANSRATSLDLQWYCGVPDEAIHVAYLGHDIDGPAVAAMRRRIGDDVEPFLLVLGTIEPRKNVAFVLDWLAANAAVLGDYRVIFCGREGWGASFAELVRDAGLVDEEERGRIKHIGFSTGEQRLALLLSARALLFPSLYEGFGLPALEAMAAGTAVIASCSTSIPEVVGPDGFYFDPLDASSLDRAFGEFRAEAEARRLQHRVSRQVDRAARFTYDSLFEQLIGRIAARSLKG